MVCQVKHLTLHLLVLVLVNLCSCVIVLKLFTKAFKCIVYNFRDAEERIAERIDANLLDVTMEDLHDMPKQLYEAKLQS